jgi:exodeoxyribonuclease VII small subunit
VANDRQAKDKPGKDGAQKGVAEMSFEEALAELERIVATLEKGQVGLEQSIVLYERGAALKAHCEQKLKSAQAKIEKIVVTAEGGTKTEPFDVT